jgi:hypothetical protein
MTQKSFFKSETNKKLFKKKETAKCNLLFA